MWGQVCAYECTGVRVCECVSAVENEKVNGWKLLQQGMLPVLSRHLWETAPSPKKAPCKSTSLKENRLWIVSGGDHFLQISVFSSVPLLIRGCVRLKQWKSNSDFFKSMVHSKGNNSSINSARKLSEWQKRIFCTVFATGATCKEQNTLNVFINFHPIISSLETCSKEIISKQANAFMQNVFWVQFKTETG